MIDESFKEFVQIAGVLDEDDLLSLIQSGAKYIGFPLRLGYHQPDLTEASACALIKKFPKDVTPVLITYEENALKLGELCKFLNISVLQIHGDMPFSEIVKFRESYPDFKIIKSLIVGKFTKDELFEQLKLYTEYVDAFITDTYDSTTGACGATGKLHDLSISCEIIRKSKKPVILAGGLNADNVYDIIVQTGAMAVDVHTGVENSEGKKNPRLVSKFIEESKRGFNFIA